MVSLEFFSDIILSVALWPWGRLVPGVFPGDKGGRCVRLTTLPPTCTVVIKSGNLNFLETSGSLPAVTGLLCPFSTDHLAPHKWVLVTTAWRILRLRMEKLPPIWRVAANILNKQSRTADKGRSSSLGIGRGANNSLPKTRFLLRNVHTERLRLGLIIW